jgi:DNA mismatch repair protein MutS
MSHGGRTTIAAIEERERSRTGIGSLKVRFNRVFGYYIEVSRSNLGLVPPDYIRKQTIAGGERFITPELKEYEEKVLRADERIQEREAEIFEALRGRVAAAARDVQRTSRAAAVLDVLATLAEVSARYNYVKPRIESGDELVYVEGRHPVMERVLPEPFVANDLKMGDGAFRLLVLTGPNMGGKSTFLRQTALIVVMAQMGCFVPAREAKVSIVDRIFTRVGATDHILRGQSTFMVEMQETAHILRHATARSLILLDEIGRGTATYDGLAIAWACAEALHDTNRCRALFATHYHELATLETRLAHVSNLSLRAKEWNGDLVFLHEAAAGPADRSYGVQVAKLAGVPPQVVARAKEVLDRLESKTESPAKLDDLPLFAAHAPINQFGAPVQAAPSRTDAALEDLDVDGMSPREALDALYRLKALLKT